MICIFTPAFKPLPDPTVWLGCLAISNSIETLAIGLGWVQKKCHVTVLNNYSVGLGGGVMIRASPIPKTTESLDKSSINIDILTVFFGPLGSPRHDTSAPDEYSIVMLNAV